MSSAKSVIENLETNCLITDSGYELGLTEGWLQGKAEGYQSSDKTGWKIHISVDEKDLSRAWDIAVQEFLQTGVEAFKGALKGTAEKHNNPDHPQAGKMIVLYETKNGPSRDKLEMMLGRIEGAFSEAGIGTGAAVNVDRPIEGSRFFFYRNQNGKDGQYISSKEAQGYSSPHNPTHQPDSMSNIKVPDLSAMEKAKVQARGVVGQASNPAFVMQAVPVPEGWQKGVGGVHKVPPASERASAAAPVGHGEKPDPRNFARSMPAITPEQARANLPKPQPESRGRA